MASGPQSQSCHDRTQRHGVHAARGLAHELQSRVLEMIGPARIAELAADERGAVLVTFALFAPVVILMAAFTMDAGNWFLHKRHLQVQADAAVFAAAREFQPCADASIYERAAQYGGDATVTTPSGTKTFVFSNPEQPYNRQEGRGKPESGLHVLINRKQY